MYNILKEIFFILKLIYIISTECFLYFIYKDYSCFIDNITYRLASINILCVKIFQAIALNNNLIDDKTNNKLLKFTDNAPWTFSDIRLEELIEITDKYDIILTKGYEKPINAGMISLIFKGYSKYFDKTVIIKLKRRNIEEQLHSAISNIQTFMYFLSFIPFIKNYELTEIVDKNISVILSQTNFRQEVENMLLIANNCVNLKYVKIPDVYKEITDEYPDCIVMEYIEGIKINEIQEKDYDIFARLIMKFGFVTALIHGVAHGDLHSGNIIFIKDDNPDIKNNYKIGIIDFGIICIIDENYKNLLFDILTEIFDRPVRETAMLAFKFGINDVNIIHNLPKIHYDDIINFITDFITEAVCNSKKANQIQLYNCLSKLKTCFDSPEIRKFGIRLNDNFIKLQLVLAMSHGVTLTLCKYDFMTFADDIINELFHTKMFIEY